MLSNFGPFGPFWPILAHSGPFWAILGHLGHSGHFGPFGPFWVILEHSGPFWAIWAILGHFGLFGPLGHFRLFWATNRRVREAFKKKWKSAGFRKKLKIGLFLNFTDNFGLEVRQVSIGFGCWEGYYSSKLTIGENNLKKVQNICQNLRRVRVEGSTPFGELSNVVQNGFPLRGV